MKKIKDLLRGAKKSLAAPKDNTPKDNSANISKIDSILKKYSVKRIELAKSIEWVITKGDIEFAATVDKTTPKDEIAWIAIDRNKNKRLGASYSKAAEIENELKRYIK